MNKTNTFDANGLRIQSRRFGVEEARKKEFGPKGRRPNCEHGLGRWWQKVGVWEIVEGERRARERLHAGRAAGSELLIM